MYPFDYQISVHLKHATVSPEEITGILGIEPTIARAIDQPMTPGTTARSEKNTWMVRINHIDGVDLEDSIDRVINTLWPFRWWLNEFTNTGGEIEFVVGWFTPRMSGAQFSPDLLRRLSDLDATLSLHVYSEEIAS